MIRSLLCDLITVMRRLAAAGRYTPSELRGAAVVALPKSGLPSARQHIGSASKVHDTLDVLAKAVLTNKSVAEVRPTDTSKLVVFNNDDVAAYEKALLAPLDDTPGG